jgi:hypothetical protein
VEVGVGERRPAAAEAVGLGLELGGEEEELFCFGVWVSFRLPMGGFWFSFLFGFETKTIVSERARAKMFGVGIERSHGSTPNHVAS